MFRKLTLYLFLLLAAIGLTYDTQSYTSGALSGSAYGIIGLSTLIALCYILPGIFLIQILRQEMAGETTCSHICSNWWTLYNRMDSWLCQYLFSRLGNCSSFFKEFLLPL